MAVGFLEIPPWLTFKAEVILDLLQYDKHSMPPVFLTTMFLSIKDKLPPEGKLIFTDGSKTDQGSGSAIAINGTAYCWTLHRDSSVYSAEAYAIWQALHYCNLDNNCKTLLLLAIL